MKRTFALVDCNNFYVSCERLFRPDLKTTPMVVLSNNDGCVVARSQEVKDLGIKMGVPLFKVMDAVERHGIEVFSSNYTLYGDISSRVMQTLEQLTPQVEVYSIDEAFLDLSGIPDLTEHGHKIRTTIAQYVGVPVCVGLAPTKTLAKLANYAAKKYKATQGVVDLTDTSRQERLMDITPVSEVWGVGRKLTESLEKIGINTALQLAQMEPKQARKRHSVVLERTVRELRGESCLELDDMSTPRKQIICSRSFGEKLTQYSDLKEAVCEFTARAASKLRQENQLAMMVNVFIRTNPFDETGPRYSNAATGKFNQPSSDTRKILELATQLLDSVWRDGYRYAKAGVMLGDFCSPGNAQFDLFTDQEDTQRSDALMKVVDGLNKKNHGKVWFGGQRSQQDWFMRRAHLSPAYTTRWDSIPKVK